VQAIRVAKTGGPEVLEWRQIDDPRPGPGELVVRLEAAGVNFVDVYQRTGLYDLPLPFIVGSEGAGPVVEVGEAVSDFKAGDVVAWCDVLGSYAQLVRVPAARAVPVPEAVGAETAAASLLQGATAHYLVRDTFHLQPGHRCLIHAAAGGVGQLLVQLAKQAGAQVFATAGGEEKCELARTAGADYVIDYQKEDFVEAVESVAGKKALDVVYDGVGKATFGDGLTLLRPRGLMVTFGNASGPPEPLSPLKLSQLGSLYLTRPTLGNYIATTEELRQRAAEVFTLIRDGRLRVDIGLRLPLSEAAEAHRRLEARETTGKVLLIP
jgi:NADPH:quinone reductase